MVACCAAALLHSAAARCHRKDRNGATPVPGPTSSSGVDASGGSRSAPLSTHTGTVVGTPPLPAAAAAGCSPASELVSKPRRARRVGVVHATTATRSAARPGWALGEEARENCLGCSSGAASNRRSSGGVASGKSVSTSSRLRRSLWQYLQRMRPQGHWQTHITHGQGQITPQWAGSPRPRIRSGVLLRCLQQLQIVALPATQPPTRPPVQVVAPLRRGKVCKAVSLHAFRCVVAEHLEQVTAGRCAAHIQYTLQRSRRRTVRRSMCGVVSVLFKARCTHQVPRAKLGGNHIPLHLASACYERCYSHVHATPARLLAAAPRTQGRASLCRLQCWQQPLQCVPMHCHQGRAAAAPPAHSHKEWGVAARHGSHTHSRESPDYVLQILLLFP